MKTTCKFPLTIALAAILLTSMLSCEKETITPVIDLKNELTPDTQMLTATKLDQAVYSPMARPFDLSFAEWTKEWWRFVMSRPSVTHADNNATSPQALTVQSGPVIFLTGITDGSAIKKITIPKDKAILVPLANVLVSYPCPDPNFKPAPGESLYSFLSTLAKENIDRTKDLEISIDGIRLGRPQDFRVATNLFRFTGNPDLANRLHPCVTGKPQDAVSDGYWVMLKKLPLGQHKLHIRTENPSDGLAVDVIYEITVQ